LNEATEQMVARGNVVVELPTTTCRIESQELHYDPLAKQIRSDQPTQFRQGGRATSAAGFTSDLEFRNFSLRSPVGPANICQQTGGP
jgi:LPS export ABC transporter protein LptC